MPRGRAQRAGRAGLGLVAVGLASCALFLVAAHLAATSTRPPADVAELRVWSTTSGPPWMLRPTVETTPAEALPTREPGAGAPHRVVIGALGIDVPVVPIRLEVNTLVPPSDPQSLGWWDQGAVPGAMWGSAIITGHTVHTGGGAMDNLETLVPGDELFVRTTRGSIAYSVRRVEVYGKERVSRAATHIFSQRVRGRLVLVTCEDWDGTGYRSNVVVVARPH